ncbi:MAG: exodeoxyribonuclease VII large subunit [Chitinivibrionales bacterium]
MTEHISDTVNDTELIPPQKRRKPYSVSDINRVVAERIESGNTLVLVEGEISNFKRSSRGHYYIKLSDKRATVSCVMWSSVAERNPLDKIDNGVSVNVIASLRVYQKGGYYQLNIHRIFPVGQGLMSAELEELRKKLEGEGLFAQERKKSLPESLSVLGVITSEHGAAVRDVIKVAYSRAPDTEVLLCATPVQGSGAVKGIVKAIKDMNSYRRAECIILTRGGGSAEDLVVFNSERVVRAVADSEIPVISAVGHQIDITLTDMAADLRAATPSEAAEIALPDKTEVKRYFDNLSSRFKTAVRSSVGMKFRRYSDLNKRALIRHPSRILQDGTQKLDSLQARYASAFRKGVEGRRDRLENLVSRLRGLNPVAVMTRGYSVVTDARGKAVTDASDLSAGEEIKIRFANGSADAGVIQVNNEAGER